MSKHWASSIELNWQDWLYGEGDFSMEASLSQSRKAGARAAHRHSEMIEDLFLDLLRKEKAE